MKIEIEKLNPPIPSNRWDYCATLDGYQPGDPIGYGATEEEARAELMEELEDV